jgi:hypothetical protein
MKMNAGSVIWCDFSVTKKNRFFSCFPLIPCKILRLNRDKLAIELIY